MLEHGGRLRAAAKKYSIPLSQWVDLSTGVNPNGWPVPVLKSEIWNRLPEDDDGLHEAAASYYGTEQLLEVSGSQAVIQLLPKLLKPCRVAIVSPCYAEHKLAWKNAGHEILELKPDEVEQHLDQLDVVVVVNPNNPTGELLAAKQLTYWHEQLSKRGGWLVVDEAFMDAKESESLINEVMPTGLIILRSLGKFFGLAGVRVGFLVAEKPLLDRVKELLGPWTVSGPSREVARQALLDCDWQLKTGRLLKNDSERLKELLSCYQLSSSGGTALFQQVVSEQAAVIFEKLANEGILVRLFKDQSRIRFGLPKNEKGWQRLENALSEI